jgi:hypothetical protein
MKGNFKLMLAVFSFVIIAISCQKQIDYGPDIALLKSDVASMKSSISSLTAQLTSLEASLKTKIDFTNSRIDTINTSLFTLTTKTLLDLSNNIKDINTSIKNTNETNKRTLDSLKTAILSTDSALLYISSASPSLLNASYNKLLSNYVSVLQVVKSNYAVLSISGKIEKGPFSKGSIISFFELDSNLSQTGRSYSTTINDNEGNYDLKATNIGGKMLRVQTDGFYYNEVLNNLSTSRIVLTGISKVDSSEKVNVNVLTHVERRRVEYLMNEKSISFDNAKKQAVSELLTIFKAGTTNISRSEKVSLFGDNNDILLNISLLFQGYRTDAQLSELLTDFSNDFYKDGTVEDVTIFKRIYNHSYFVDTVSVASNIKEKYSVTPNSFSILNNYLKDNVARKDEKYMPITYPAIVNEKKNFLTRVTTETITSGVQGCLMYNKNDIPTFDFKVTIKTVNAAGSNGGNVWFYNIGSGWSVTSFQFDNFGNQTFYTNNPVGEVGLEFMKGQYDLYFYEPANAKTPTFVKRITVN